MKESFQILRHEREKHSDVEKFRSVLKHVSEQYHKEEKEKKYTLTYKEEIKLLELIDREIEKYLCYKFKKNNDSIIH